MDLEKLWKNVLAEVELSVSKPIYKTQFAPTRLVSLENNVATIGFTNPLMRTMVEARYYSLVKSILDHHTGENTSLLFLVVPKTEKLTDDQAGPLQCSFFGKLTGGITAQLFPLQVQSNSLEKP